jgi:hypothetical protein
MTKKRIDFNAWGMGDLDEPEYAMRDEHVSSASAVARAIARMNGLSVATLKGEGQALDGRGTIEANHYSSTLGHPCRGGGWTPVQQVWFSIPIGGRY